MNTCPVIIQPYREVKKKFEPRNEELYNVSDRVREE
jgi:hypothetical protein